MILDPGSRIHLNLPLKAPPPLWDSLSGVELALATEIGLLSSLGKCGCEGGPGELPGLRLGEESDKVRLLLSGVRSAEIGLLSCIGDCGSLGDCDRDLECLTGIAVCRGVYNIPGLYLSGDGVLSPLLLLDAILAEWTSVICW